MKGIRAAATRDERRCTGGLRRPRDGPEVARILHSRAHDDQIARKFLEGSRLSSCDEQHTFWRFQAAAAAEKAFVDRDRGHPRRFEKSDKRASTGALAEVRGQDGVLHLDAGGERFVRQLEAFE